MKRINVVLCLCAMLLSTAACASKTELVQATDAPTVITALETPAPAPQETAVADDTAAGYGALRTLLLQIFTDYLPGTAGCSLQAAKLAGQLLDWYALHAPDSEMVTASMRAVSQSLPPNAGAQYGEQFNDIHGAAIALTGEYAADYLESAGYAPTSAVPYASMDVDALFDALRAGLDETAKPFLRPVDASMPFQMDIDGDGTQETVTVRVDEDAYTAELNISGTNRTYSENLDTALMFLTAYVGGACAGSDGQTLYLCGDMASNDYATFIFRVKDGVLQHDEIYGTILDANADGEVTIEAVVDVFGTYGGTCNYRVNDDFSFTICTPYTVCRPGSEWGERSLTVICEALPVVSEDAKAGITLPKGTELRLLETDEASYAILEDRQAARYRVDIERHEDDWQWYLNGVPEGECFTPLLYAG